MKELLQHLQLLLIVINNCKLIKNQAGNTHYLRVKLWSISNVQIASELLNDTECEKLENQDFLIHLSLHTCFFPFFSSILF